MAGRKNMEMVDETQENMENLENALAESEGAVSVPEKSDKETIRLFYDGDKYKDPLFVAVNGKTYLIERGVDVEVPKSVAEVIRNRDVQLHDMKNTQKMLENVQYKTDED